LLIAHFNFFIPKHSLVMPAIASLAAILGCCGSGCEILSTMLANTLYLNI